MALRSVYLRIKPVTPFFCITAVFCTNVSEISAYIPPNAIDAVTTRAAIVVVHPFAIRKIACFYLWGEVRFCIVASHRHYQDCLKSKQCSPA